MQCEKMMEHLEESTNVVKSTKKLIGAIVLNIITVILLVTLSMFLPDKSYYLILVFCLAIVSASVLLYQIYQLTVIDAAARGLKHPKLWGLLAANGNNSSGLLLYLIGRRNYPVNSMDSRQVMLMDKRKKAAGIGLVFVAVGAIGLVVCMAGTGL